MIRTRLTCELSGIDVGSIACLYESVGFGKACAYTSDPDLLSSMFGKGVYGIFVVLESKPERVIGCARVLSDNVCTSWLAEVCVHPDFQKQGLGRLLIEEALDQFGHTAIYSEVFESQVSFFSSLGIRAKKKLVAVGRKATCSSNERSN